MRIYLLIAAIAGGVTWLVTPLIRHVAIHIGAVGEVRARDVHTIPTPRMGGLGMLIGFAFAMIYSSRIAFTTGLFENNNQEWVILAGAVLICLLGMADDLWDLDWMLKMAGQLLISVFVAWGGSMLLGYLITCASIVMTGRLDPASIHASVYLPVFMPILLPILVLFLPVLDMCLAIVRRLSHGQSPMHPDRMHLHHRMLRIGHTVQGAVLILWGWAALIAVGSIMTLFFKVHYVLIGFVIAVVLLTVATMYPYLKRRLPEIAAENQSYASARRRARHSFDESGDGKKRRP